MWKDKCGKNLLPRTLWKTINLFTIFSTYKYEYSCGFGPLFHIFFAYCYHY